MKRFFLLFFGTSMLMSCQKDLPQLEITETFYEFDYLTKERTIRIDNTGNGLLNWETIPSHDWINIEPASGTIPGNSFEELSFTVSKLMPKGNYGGLVTVNSNGGSKDIIISNVVPFSLEYEAIQLEGTYRVLSVRFRTNKDITEQWKDFKISFDRYNSFETTSTPNQKIWPSSGNWNFYTQSGGLESQEIIFSNDRICYYQISPPRSLYIRFNYEGDDTVPEYQGSNGLYEFNFFKEE